MPQNAYNHRYDQAVCHAPLAISEVEADGVHLVARPGLRFRVDEASEDMLMITEPRLGLHVLARDKQELQRSLEHAIVRLWREHEALAVPSAGQKDWRVRAVLRALFKPY